MNVHERERREERYARDHSPAELARMLVDTELEVEAAREEADGRIVGLLDANNRLVEERRAARAEADGLRLTVAQMEGEVLAMLRRMEVLEQQMAKLAQEGSEK